MKVLVSDAKTTKVFHRMWECRAIRARGSLRFVGSIMFTEIEQEEAEKRGLAPCKRCAR